MKLILIALLALVALSQRKSIEVVTGQWLDVDINFMEANGVDVEMYYSTNNLMD